MEVSDQNFEVEVLRCSGPVMVDFWAEWCTPCRMVGPIIADFAKKYQNRIKICRLDVDANPAVTGRFAIHSIPSLLFFNNGRLVDQIVGACTQTKLNAVADEVLDKI